MWSADEPDRAEHRGLQAARRARAAGSRRRPARARDPPAGRCGSGTRAPSRRCPLLPRPGAPTRAAARDSATAPAIVSGMLCAVNTSRAACAHIGRQPLERRAHVRGVGRDEQRMVEPAADVRDVDVAAACARSSVARGGDVLAVLLAARVRMLRRSDEADRAPRAGLVHLPQRVRAATGASCACRRRPAADVPPPPAAARSPSAWRRVSLGDRRDAAKQLVVMGHFLDALRARRGGRAARWPGTGGCPSAPAGRRTR